MNSEMMTNQADDSSGKCTPPKTPSYETAARPYSVAGLNNALEKLILISPVAQFFSCCSLIIIYLHTIHFTHLKYTTQWILVHLQCCANTTAINFRTFSSPLKRNAYPSAVTQSPQA